MLKNRILKIKAFTLSEMIVTIVITIIVVGLAFSILSLIQKQMYGLESNFEKETDINLLRQALWIDFRKHQHIYYNKQGQILTCKNEVNKVVYHFNPDYITRKNDTFRISTHKIIVYFDGKKVTSGFLDAIQLITGKEKESLKIFVHKPNTANKYIN